MVKALSAGKILGGRMVNAPTNRSFMSVERIPWFGTDGMLSNPTVWRPIRLSGRCIFYNPTEGARVPLELIFEQGAGSDNREPSATNMSTSATAKPPSLGSNALILRPGAMLILPHAPGKGFVRPATGSVNTVPAALPNLPVGWDSSAATAGMQGVRLFVEAELMVGDEFSVLDAAGDAVQRVELPGILNVAGNAVPAAARWNIAGTEAELGTITFATPESLVPLGFARRFKRALLHVGHKTDTEYEGLILPYFQWANDLDGQIRAYPFGCGLRNTRTSVTLDVTATMNMGFSSGIQLAMSGVGGTPIRTIDAVCVLDMGHPADVNEIVPLRSHTYYSSGGSLTAGGTVITSGTAFLILHAAPSCPTDLTVARGHLHTSGYNVAMLNWVSTTGSGAPSIYRADANIAAPIAPSYLHGGTGGFVFAQRGAMAMAVASSGGATAQLVRAEVSTERGV